MFDAFLTAQRGRFVLFLPVFMAAGILAYFDRSAEPALAWSGFCAVAAAGLAASVWRWPVPRAAALCVAFACAGWALACLATARAPAWPVLPRHAVVVTGRVAELEVLPEGRRVTLAAPSLDGEASVARALRIRLRNTDVADVAPGDLLRVRALVRPPPPPDYPGGWDTQREAFFAGLAGYGFAIGPAAVLQPGGGTGWWAAVRTRVAQRLMNGLPGVPGAIAATLLTGLGTAIPPDDRAAFRDSGLAHLLAVAGLHIGIVMGLVFAATRFTLATWEWAALHWPTRQIAAVAALGAGAGYLALTGAHVPILRSFAMACLVTLGVLTGRRAVSLRALALAALVLMVLAPVSVVGVSFQMSFSAVLTLITGYELAQPALLLLGHGAWWRRPAVYVSGLGADQHARRHRVAAVRRLPFRPGDAVLRAGQHAGRAADGAVGDAVGAGSPGADAPGAGAAGAGAHGLGTARSAEHCPRGRRLAGRQLAGAANARLGPGAGLRRELPGAGCGAGGCGWAGYCRWRSAWPRPLWFVRRTFWSARRRG